jgi:hypothetical protein
MHPAASKALFEEDVATLTSALATRRGWQFHSLDYPVIDCSLSATNRTPLRLKFDCNNWNDSPPAITLHTQDGALVTARQNNPTGIFHPDVHPVTHQFFICMKGTREYHTHPSHVADAWENVRGHTNYSLGGILTQIWNGWLKGSG